MTNLDVSSQPTISIVAAAEKLNTHRGIIQRWIDEGRIEVAERRVLQAPFEQLCQEIEIWLKEFDNAEDFEDEEGHTSISVEELEEFWKSR